MTIIRTIFICIYASLCLVIAACVDGERMELYRNGTTHIRVAIFKSEYGGYGYDIFENDKLKIHQSHVPAMERLRGFDTREEAQQAAQLVIEKLKQRKSPPTISKSDLEKIGVSSGR